MEAKESFTSVYSVQGQDATKHISTAGLGNVEVGNGGYHFKKPLAFFVEMHVDASRQDKKSKSIPPPWRM